MLVVRRTRASGACGATRPDVARGSPAERVTSAAHGLNQTRTAAEFEFVAQVLDSHVDEVRITEIVEAPHVLQDLLPRQHLARMTQEQLEELVLSRGQLQQIPITSRFTFAGDELDVLEAQYLNLARLNPTQQGAHARHQLIGVEGFNNVVVGAAIEAGGFVDGLVARGEHQNGNGAFATNRTADLEAVAAGHHDVEDEQVDRFPPQDVEG